MGAGSEGGGVSLCGVQGPGISVGETLPGRSRLGCRCLPRIATAARGTAVGCRRHRRAQAHMHRGPVAAAPLPPRIFLPCSDAQPRSKSVEHNASSSTLRRPASAFVAVAADTEAIFTALRGTLRATLDRVLPSDYSARSLGRYLEVDRMTAWRCWTIAHVADPAQALRAMPGGRAWPSLLSRLAKRGATAEEVAAIRREVERFEVLVQERSLDRQALKTIAAGAPGSERERAAIVAARRSASRGATSLYGIHAKTMLVAVLLAPGRPGDTLVSATLGIIDGLRRLRPGAPWPIMQHSVTSGSARGGARRAGPGKAGSLPTLLRDASTPGIAEHELTEQADPRGVTVVSLGDLREEHRGGIRVTAADSNRVGRFGDDEVEPFELSISFLFPADLAVVDLLVHRDLARHTDPVASLIGTPIGPHNFEQARLASRLPLESAFRSIEAGVASHRMKAATEAYAAGLLEACKRLRRDLDEFEAFRFELPYPPAFAAASASVELRNPRSRRRTR